MDPIIKWIVLIGAGILLLLGAMIGLLYLYCVSIGLDANRIFRESWDEWLEKNKLK